MRTAQARAVAALPVSLQAMAALALIRGQCGSLKIPESTGNTTQNDQCQQYTSANFQHRRVIQFFAPMKKDNCLARACKNLEPNGLTAPTFAPNFPPSRQEQWNAQVDSH